MEADVFILKTDREGLRAAGCPWHPDHAIRLSKQGLFPPPVHLSPRRAGWFRSSITGWLASKEAPRLAA